MEKVKSKPFFLSKDEQTQEIEDGISRQIIVYDNNIMMVKVLFEKDAFGSPHSHPHSQTSYVVSGKFKVEIGEEIMILSTGDGFYAEPNVIHSCLCLDKGELIDVFNPIREDFLK